MNPAAVGAPANDPLGVVIPAYNEGLWVERALAALRTAAEAASWTLDVVIVDDGSSDSASRDVLQRLSTQPQVRVVRQSNRGRFVARKVGLRALSTHYVLLLDSRVEIDPHALTGIAAAIEDADTEVWNLDVTPGSRDPRALFWTGLTKVWWRDYFVDRRHVSFGIEDFDRYPKGTGAFFAPRILLLDAIDTFTSFFSRADLASDDTRLLREVARRQRINLAPEITSRHYVKAGWRAWSRQCYFRGTTFVDGYLAAPSRALPLLGVGVLALMGGGVLLARAPRLATALGAAGSAVAAGRVQRDGGSLSEAASVGVLLPPFAVLFGAGVARGLWYAARAGRNQRPS